MLLCPLWARPLVFLRQGSLRSDLVVGLPLLSSVATFPEPFSVDSCAGWAAAQDAPAIGMRICGSTKTSGSVQLSSSEQCALSRVSDSVAALLPSPGDFVRLFCFVTSVRAFSFGAGLFRMRWRVHRESLSRCSSPSELPCRRLPLREMSGMPSDSVAASSMAAPRPLSSRIRAFCAVWLDRLRPWLL